MSCEDCEKEQKSSRSAYIRWKTSNVEIRGCDKHLREIFSKLFDRDYNKKVIYLLSHPHL